MVETQEADPASGKRMKKLEKSPASTNREYLDLDTDEEEFGRQETPEPEEELILEPEKPIFSEEELETLVQYVKDFTTIPALTEVDWSREIIELVKEYFCSPANTVLAIFLDGSRTLRALLDFPECSNAGLTYFLRTPWQVYTPENFLSTVIFGSLDGGVENSTLKFMENMYAPIAFRSDEWPAVMRNEIFSNLHEFLLCLTEVTYSPMGLTILYVPREGLEDDFRLLPEVNDYSTIPAFDEKETGEPRNDEEEGLVERLERVARYWIRQIREALKVPSAFTESSPCKTIVDEIRYWHYRHENLSCVLEQLTNKSVLSIVKKLESVRSASVKQYDSLVSEVRGMLDEAISNITYLNLLEEFSRGFEIPDGVEDYATRIFLLIRFIGRESPFYNTREKIETLCQACCTQAVEHCRECIDLDVLLHGDANAGRDNIVRCIESCDKIGSIYDRLVKMDVNSNDSPSISLTDKSTVFNNVATFVHRCNDLIGIADERIVFDKCDEEIIVCGSRGLELGLHYRKIEEKFYAILTEIKDARDDILDIVSSAWLDRIAAFKRGIRDVENMVKNWIDDIFKGIFNVEEGIEALHGIERFSKRPYLRETLNNKWIEIWKMFGNECESCSVVKINKNTNTKLLHHPSLPAYSGNAHILRSNSVYLTRQYKMLIDASDWFGDCDAQTIVTSKYKQVLSSIAEQQNALFSDWQKELADARNNLVAISSHSIIKYYDNSKPGSITPNLEIRDLDHIREIAEWTILNYDTKNIIFKDCPKWEMLKTRYNIVETLCKLYNEIVTNISDTERFLFLTLLEDLEETMSPAFKKATWSSESFERLVPDCMEILINVQESLEVYRASIFKIDRIIEEIGVTRLVNSDNSLADLLQDSAVDFERNRNERVQSVGKKCEEMLKLLLTLKSSLNTDMEKTLKHWNQVVERIYQELKTSLIGCIRLSLENALRLFQSDELIEHPPVAETDATKSQMDAVEKAIAGINASAFEELSTVAGFADLFSSYGGLKEILHCIDKDSQLLDLKKDIEALFRPSSTE